MIGAIENAIVSRIAAASQSGALGYQLRTVKSYAGDLEPDLLAEVIRQFPAVWVLYAGEAAPREIMADTAWRYAPRFSVYVGARNLRNEAASRQGAAGTEIGSYQILEDVRRLLAGHRLGLPIGPLVPGAVRSALQSRDISIYGLSVETLFDEDALALPSERLGEFLHLHMDWDAPPHGNVAPPLPAAEADARDDVFLDGVPE